MADCREANPATKRIRIRAGDWCCRALDQLVGCNEIKELQNQFFRTKIRINFLTKPVQNVNADLLMKPKKCFNFG
jgi:hypothetical protein